MSMFFLQHVLIRKKKKTTQVNPSGSLLWPYIYINCHTVPSSGYDNNYSSKKGSQVLKHRVCKQTQTQTNKHQVQNTT